MESTNTQKKIIIGLTGGIASGKSQVCQALHDAGFFIIDADQVSREIVSQGGAVTKKITETFGKTFLTNPDEENPLNWEIDRKKLGRLVFSDKDALIKLEEITHPAIRERIIEMARKAEGNVVIEAIRLFTSGLNQYCNYLWLVKAEPQEQLRRLVEERAMEQADAEARISAQLNADWRGKVFDAVIVTNGTKDQLDKTVKQVLKKLLTDEKENGKIETTRLR